MFSGVTARMRGSSSNSPLLSSVKPAEKEFEKASKVMRVRIMLKRIGFVFDFNGILA